MKNKKWILTILLAVAVLLLGGQAASRFGAGTALGADHALFQAHAEGTGFFVDATPFQVKAVVGSQGYSSSMQTVYAAVEATDQTLSQEDARAILGASGQVDVYLADVGLYLADTKERVSLADGASAFVTFHVPGVTPRTKAVVRHWTGNGNFEDIYPAPGEGTLTVSLRSLSPVAVIVDTTAVPQPEMVQAAAPDSGRQQWPSADTGDENGFAVVYGGICMTLICAAAGCLWKKMRTD